MCDRLVGTAITDPVERAQRRGLVGAALTLPLVLTSAIFVTLAGSVSLAVLLAILCGVLAGGWGVAAWASLPGERRRAGPCGLMALTLAVSAIVAMAGGAGSPLMALAAIPAVEGVLARLHRAVGWGIAGSAVVVAVQLAGLLVALPAAAAGAAGWLPVVLYGLSVGLRGRSGGRQSGDDAPAISAEDAAARLSGGLVLDLDMSGSVRSVHGAAEQLAGVAPEALAGTVLVDRIHVADRVGFMTALDAARNGEARHEAKIRLRLGAAREGQYGTFAISLCRTSHCRAGSEAQVQALLLPDTEAEQLRGELAELGVRVDEAEIAKGRFLGAVSHELRTPLNAIIGFSDMMLHNMAGELLPGRQREYVGLIRDSGQHLLSVVNSILDVSKIEAGAYSIQPEPFRLCEALDLCGSMMAPLAGARGVVLETRARPGLGEIVADRRAVQQMLINLVSNAVKFTPHGGRVEVDAVRNGGRVELVVQDTGIGIGEADLQRLGQPFVQVCNDLTRQYEGTGLGLSLVKGLVRLHQGEMSIESAPGEGTTVRISLPAKGPAMQATVARIASTNQITTSERDSSNAKNRKIA